MAFDKATTVTPTEIRDVSIVLTDYVATPNESAHQAASYSVQVHHDNGDIKILDGDLVPHLTQGQIDALMGFMNDLRTKAEAEILP